VIASVVEGGSAAELGLRPGTIITKVDHKLVGSPEEFRSAVEAADLAKGVLLNVIDEEGNARFEVLKRD
jgi:S1-C subfamily serine protease